MGKVTTRHFGANLLAFKKEENPSNLHSLKEGSDFSKNLADSGIKFIRFPGGGITEGLPTHYNDINVFFKDNIDVPFKEAIDYCLYNGAKLHFVLPTFVFLKLDDIQIVQFLNKISSYKNAFGVIETFEIGNEYWAEISASEYGKIARRIVKILEQFQKGHGTNIPVYLQKSPHWLKGENFRDIYNEFGFFDFRKIDGFIDHWYPADYPGASNYSKEFDKPDVPFIAELFGLDEKPQHFSEWNLNSKKDGPRGLKQGYQMSNMLWALANRNIRYASVWGFQYRYLNTRLFGVKSNDSTFETAVGSVFRTFSKLLHHEAIFDSLGRPIFDHPKHIVMYAYGASKVKIVDAKGSIHITEFTAYDDLDTKINEEQDGQHQLAVVRKTSVPHRNELDTSPDRLYIIKVMK